MAPAKKTPESSEKAPAKKAATAKKTTKKASSASSEASSTAKRRVGRPKGSKNKALLEGEDSVASVPAPVAEKPAARKPRAKKPTKEAAKDTAAATPTPSPATESVFVAPAASVESSKASVAPEASVSASVSIAPPAKKAKPERKDRRDDRRDEHVNYGTIETVGGENSNNQGGKRGKRRRNRRGNGEGPHAPAQTQSRPTIDAEEQQRYAWKIFLGEVTEEGLAFMDDKAATDAARRAFRIAEIYLTEASRWTNPRPQPQYAPAVQQMSEAAPMQMEILSNDAPEAPAVEEVSAIDEPTPVVEEITAVVEEELAPAIIEEKEEEQPTDAQ